MASNYLIVFVLALVLTTLLFQTYTHGQDMDAVLRATGGSLDPLFGGAQQILGGGGGGGGGGGP